MQYRRRSAFSIEYYFFENLYYSSLRVLDLNDIYEENEDEIDEDDENDLKKDTNKNYKIGF